MSRRRKQGKNILTVFLILYQKQISIKYSNTRHAQTCSFHKLVLDPTRYYSGSQELMAWSPNTLE